ncbi:MAG: 2Fe-2S iron-sulfur cluster-binding protein [Desulfurispora sp.]|uniref:2Fe-2S iron-sulfur cluster-binding protein n=1 Tax=Desulfurispora sp. TaxID=3014275 RepID=UPI00404AE0D8
MSQVTLTIDGQTVQARAGQKLLAVALENGIFIPHLCSDGDHSHPPAACRLCFVQVEGMPAPVTACTLPVAQGMVVHTRSAAVDQLVADGFALIMAAHRLECKSCPKNGHCALQEIAKKRGLRLRPKDLPLLERDLPVDDSHPQLLYDPGKCVLCGRCVQVCRQQGNGVLGFVRRGFARRVSTFAEQPLGSAGCSGCLACARVCPVGALVIKEA